ncbi:MAG TPA: class A beta-lactamase [Steroidobacteraceae bacterium]|nr:class A beta-lactamase [Steroidobacteraceae bacterium]
MTQQQFAARDFAARLRISRRTLFAAAVSTVVAGACAHRFASLQREFTAAVGTIQARIGGRIGVYVLDTESQLELAFNARERFAMCSTFKLLLAAAVFQRVEAGTLALDDKLAVRPEDIVPHAPITSAHVAEGSMSVRDLCAAIVTVSDNAAANILLKPLGGPAALTRFLRDIGDRVTRLDRTEVELNTNLPGDPRDTTTPQAMALSMENILLGDVLSMQSRLQLIAWMRQSTTGLRRLRAAVPAQWKPGDKTGNGRNGAANNLMVAWPPGRSAVLAAVYMSESAQPVSALDDAHVEIGRLLAAAVARQ